MWNKQIIRLSTHFHNITTIGAYLADQSFEFTAVSQLLGFSNIADNLEVKDNSLDLSLSGVGQELTSLVLGNAIEGSRVYVSRSFYNENTGELVDVPYQRWAGRINSYSIQDDYRFSSNDKIVISVQCRSLLLTLLERVTGRYTNKVGYEQYMRQYTQPLTENDQSMEFIASLVNFAPNFGKED